MSHCSASAPNHSSIALDAAIAACAKYSTKTNGSTMPISVSGTTTNLTTGIAIAFATGEPSDICWNIASNNGIRPSVIAHCTRAHATSQCSGAMRPVVTNMITATAPNDSQNPSASTAHGSITSTTNNAAHNTTEAELKR